MFYYIFKALFSVLISMPIFTFKVCWEIPCGEAFYLQKPSLELITSEKKLQLMTHVWNYQVIICSVLITLRIIKETFVSGFLKTTDQPSTYHRPTISRPTNHRAPTNQPPTKFTDHRPTAHRPVRNLRTRQNLNSYLTYPTTLNTVFKIMLCIMHTR